MITFWDYADTELPSTDTMRSKHMKDMGQKGWELVSVSANLANGSHVYFWKRLITEGKNSVTPNDDPEVKSPTNEYPQPDLKDVKIGRQSTNHQNGYAKEMSRPNYNKFPEPQIVMIVKYRPKVGCFNEFRKELYKRDYPNCITRHMGSNGRKEFVCVSLMENIDAALDLEGVGTNWLDSVEHLLIKYPNGSRTESFSGPVLNWHPNFEKLRAFDEEPKAFSVVVVKMKQGAVAESKELILNPPTTPRTFFNCLAQYKDTDDTYIHVRLYTSDREICEEDYSQNTFVNLEETSEFFNGQEDFLWFNKEYL